MKLSDAIREGCKVTRPTTGQFFLHPARGLLYACALGAAWLGTGRNPVTEELAKKRLRQIWPCLMQTSPDPAFVDMRLFDAIVYLNDWDGTYREEIADWLDTLDLNLESA